MTDSKVLQKRIMASGYKLKFIDHKLGVSYQTLLNKIDNRSEFKATEIFELCKILNLNAEEKEAIFFASLVE